MIAYKRYFNEEFDEDGRLLHASLSYPENYNFAYDVVDVLGETKPEKLAMRWRNTKKQGRDFSFGEMKRLSNKMANLLKSWGFAKGDILMVSLRTHYEYWYIALGAHKLGVILCPVFHLLSVEDFAYRMAHSGAKALICTPEGDTPQRIYEGAEQVGLKKLYTLDGKAYGFGNFTEELEKASEIWERVPTLASEAILLYFTSGTTGKPKGVLHNHAFTLSAVMGARYMQDNGPDSLHFATGNTAWEVICGTKFYGQWLCESSIFVFDYERFDPKMLLEQLEKEKVTSMMAQPTVYRQLLTVGMDKYDLSRLTNYAVGGEKLTRDVAEAVFSQTGYHLYEGYAQSEAGLISANSKNAGRKEGSVGVSLKKYHVEILKEDGSFAAPNEVGEIVILADKHKKPEGLLMGYFKDPRGDAVLWDGDVFHTNDLAYMDEDGFLFYLGRMDGIIKVRGYRVSPFEIENELSRHWAVYECMAVGEGDMDYGQRVKVYVKVVDGLAPSEDLKRELLAFYNDGCTGYKKIRSLEFVRDLKRNQNGKLIRNQFANT